MTVAKVARVPCPVASKPGDGTRLPASKAAPAIPPRDGDQTGRGHLRVASSFVGFERARSPLLYDAGL